MKFEDIKRVNETIITTDIKGKQYAEVNQRIKAFRMLYPEGTIQTYIVSLEDGVCVMRAEVKNGEIVLGTGTAYEKENSTFINRTSFIENAETSCVGRALAMCGIGIDTSIASKEEVENAIEQQEQDKKEQDERLQLIVKIKKLMFKKNILPEEINAKYEKSSTDMSNEELKNVIEWIETLDDFDYKKEK